MNFLVFLSLMSDGFLMQTLCAVCPNNNEVHLYKVSGNGSKWDRQCILKVRNKGRLLINTRR